MSSLLDIFATQDDDMNLKHFSLVPAAFAVAFALAGCPGSGDGDGTIDPPSSLFDCETSQECADRQPGTICAQGLCTQGECDPLLLNACRLEGLDSPFCCKVFELCNPVNFQCEFDPTVEGIGCEPDDVNCTPCETDDDCRGGQFCSAARCLDAAGRQDCVTSFDCPAGERCDRTVFLCVEDRGACQFCGADFPELCCEEGQTCSQQDGFCRDIEDPECDTAEDCGDGEPFCNPTTLQCAECLEDDDCGPGLLCDTGIGTCFSDGLRCTSDEECDGNKRCAIAIEQCVLPQCEDDGDCATNPDFDSRYRCDIETFLCNLPPPVCAEDFDEPNNSVDDSSPIENFSAVGQLCRGDSDVWSFAVIPEKRYEVTVNFGGGGQEGIIVTLLGTQAAVESTITFNQQQAQVQVVGITIAGESGFFHVKIDGNNTDRDFFNYTITVEENEPLPIADCTPAGQPEEPNDTIDTAFPITLDQLRTFSRCGLNDVDFFRVTVPSLNGVRGFLNGFSNAEGNLNLQLLRAPNTQVDVSNSVNDLEDVEGPEGPTEYFLKVSLGNTAGAVTEQTFRVEAEAVPRPAACFPDPTEDDGTIALAKLQPAIVLTPDAQNNPGAIVTDIVRCNPQDVDVFRFTMPTGRSGVVRTRFNNNEGNMKLELRREDTVDPIDPLGVLVDSSDVSNATSDPDEQVEIPGSADTEIEYFVRVLLNSATGGTTGQRYTLEIATFDDSQCIASEPPGGDNIFAGGRCVGEWDELSITGGPVPCTNDASRIPEPMQTATLATCAAAPEGTVAGCGRICGNDDKDFYRIGPVNEDAVIHATLTYNFTDGELQLVRNTLNNNGSVTATATSDNDDNGVVEFFFATPRGAAKEFAIEVKPFGALGHQVQPYALQIEVGPQCFDDEEDVGANVNEKPADATIIRPNPQPGNFAFNSSTAFDPTSSRCSNDVDVYEFISFAGEDVTVTLNQVDPSPGGLAVELGTRPDNLNNAAVLVANGSSVAGGPAVTFLNEETQQLYVTVRAPTGVVVTGPYVLTIVTAP